MTSADSDVLLLDLMSDENWLPMPTKVADTRQPMWIVVTGPFHSGKTTFIQSICDEQIWWNFSRSQEVEINGADAEALQSSFFLSHCGKLVVDNDLIVNFLDIPGARRFDALWKIARRQLLGFVLIIDSTDPRQFREARSLLATFKSYFNVPYVVAANKQDHLDAWSIQDLRIALGMIDYFTGAPDNTPVIPCIATRRASVKNVLLSLLYLSIAALEYDDYRHI